MPKQLSLRELTEHEKREINRIANSRTEPIRQVERAKIVQTMVEDAKLPAAKAGRLVGGVSDAPGRLWVKRFNAQGLAGLEDEARSGCPHTHTEQVGSTLNSLATPKPDSLGHAFKLWTLERLQVAFEEREKVHLSDSTIWRSLDEEGLEWERQESWFHEAEKHDAQFVENRGHPASLPRPAAAHGGDLPYNWRKQPQEQPMIPWGGLHPELTRKTVLT